MKTTTPPHAMTVTQYIHHATGRHRTSRHLSHQRRSNAEKFHRRAIEASIEAGRPVPLDVLADYPDLLDSATIEAPTTLF